MDWNYWLSLMVCFFCLAFLVRIFRASPRQNLGWIAVCSGILGITLLMLYLAPMIAGLTGFVFWGILLVIPSLGFSRVKRLVYQQKYGQASQLMSWLRWLHPADGWLDQPLVFLALDAAQKGNLNQAAQLLQRYEKSPYHSQVLLYWIKADWNNCLAWFNQSVPKSILLKDPLLISYYLRSLGETGDLNGLVQGLEIFENFLVKKGDIITYNLGIMYVLAFCGQTSQVRQLFKGVLSVYSKNFQTFWILTSQMIAGQEELARQQFLNLRLTEDLILCNAIEWRLCHPPKIPNLVLDQSSRHIIFRLKHIIGQEFSGRIKNKFTLKNSYMTLILIALNLGAFALEIYQGGSENLDILYNLGGLVPQEILAGQWWRVVTANFLHYGWLHLASNMMGLYFVGRFVELALGKFRYLLVYFFSGVGAMTLFSLLSIKLGNTGEILVGASAGIMGLVGGIFALFVRDWWQEKSPIATKRLQVIFVVVCLQFIFDRLVPEVSSLSHFLGLVIGFITGGLLLIHRQEATGKR